jgi:putative endonuclease
MASMIGTMLDALRHVRRRGTWNWTAAQGRRGEDLAHRFLRRQGYVIVARNYRLPGRGAEADLLAWDGDTLVVVEVKSRETGAYGPPERAIGPEKFHHMLRVAREFSRKTGTPWERVRLDVVTVVLTQPAEIALWRGAWRPKR